MGGGGLSMAGGPPAAGLSAGPDPADVEFGEPEQMGLSDLEGLHRDAMREHAKQGRRNTREARRERRRMSQGLADAELLMEMGAGQDRVGQIPGKVDQGMPEDRGLFETITGLQPPSFSMDRAMEEEKKFWGKGLEDLKNSPAAAQWEWIKNKINPQGSNQDMP